MDVTDDETPVENAPDPDEWQRWLCDHASRLFLYARQQTRNESDAEDVLQESLVEAWERCGGRAPPLALALATIRRRAIDLGRCLDARERRSVAHPPAEAWFEPDIEDREMQLLLIDAVKNLPPLYCEVVTLKIWGGLTFQQISDMLGVPLNTAASRYRYGLEELRQSLKEVFS